MAARRALQVPGFDYLCQYLEHMGQLAGIADMILPFRASEYSFASSLRIWGPAGEGDLSPLRGGMEDVHNWLIPKTIRQKIVACGQQWRKGVCLSPASPDPPAGHKLNRPSYPDQGAYGRRLDFR